MRSVPIANDNILVLPSWYPSQVDITSGDFVQRHIEAIALFHSQYVIYVVKDQKGMFTKNVLKNKKVKDNYQEEIIYYRPWQTGSKIVDKFLSDRQYRKHYKNAIRTYIKDHGMPTLVHVHVAIKAGLIACWLLKKYKIPFIVSEHSTAYLPEADVRLKDYGFIYNLRLRSIFKKASAVTVVSQHLYQAIAARFPEVKIEVIPNVYNANIFFPTDKTKNNSTIFVHASIMNYQKNTLGIIEAFSVLRKNHHDFLLKLFGPLSNEIKEAILHYDLSSEVSVEGNVPQADLARSIQQCDAVIMNSRFETFGCVIIEANACGIPAIVTDIPVFNELIHEDVNGVFVKEGDIEALAEALLQFIVRPAPFDKKAIVASAKKYNYESVGKMFYVLYENILKKKSL